MIGVVTSLVTHNWKLKVGSVFMASLLWLSVVEETEITTSAFASIQYRNVPKDLEISSDLTDRVQLEIRGPASKLGPTMLNDTRVLVDLGSVSRAGERTFPIDRAHVVLPSGVQLDRSSPAQVHLTFESRHSKSVKVRVRIGRRPPAGYRITVQEASPAELLVVGPASQVNRLEAVETDPIDVDDLKEGNETFPVQAYLAERNVRFAGDGKVSVRVEVTKEQ